MNVGILQEHNMDLTSMMEEKIRLVCYGLSIFRKYARAEKTSNDLIARHYNNSIHGHSSLVYLQTGSFAEGFADVVSSDVDWMVVLNSPEEIITADWQAKVFKTVEEAPAHVKIKIPVVDIQEFQRTFRDISQFYCLLDTSGGGEDYGYISAKMARTLNQNDFLPDSLKHNKPSAPWEHKDNDEASPSYCFQSETMKNVTVDRVPALQCAGWPQVAHEWVNRKRCWPDSRLVKKISSGDFYIIPKPSHISGDHEHEWRFSFSLAEAELMQSFGEIQVRVYYVLRSLYLKRLKERVKGILSSYTIKTILLWMLEDVETGFWLEENVVYIIRSFFERLYQSMENGFCAHYFIPKHNLLYRISRLALNIAIAEVKMLLVDPVSALNDITEKGYLGMMPRFGLWNVDVKSRIVLKLLELPEHEAFQILTSESHGDTISGKSQIFIDILTDAAVTIKASPATELGLIHVNLPLILGGYQLASESEGEASMRIFNELKKTRPDPESQENITRVNNSILLWVELYRVALEQALLGDKTRLTMYFNRVYTLLSHGGTFEEQMRMPEFKLFQDMCSISSRFLVSVNLKATKIDYTQLLFDLDEIADGCIDLHEEPNLCGPVVFALSGGTLQMTNIDDELKSDLAQAT